MDGGIKLDLDDGGEVQIIQEKSEHDCVANITCSYATRTETDNLITITCNFENKIRNVFLFKHCPAKKWHRYQHRHSPEKFKEAKGCYMCGHKKQWRIKSGKWTCPNCHPPAIRDESRIETRKYEINDTSTAGHSSD
jgi:hypothetical protein